MFVPEIAVGVAIGRLGVKMSAVMNGEAVKNKAQVHYTRDDLTKAELEPGDVSLAMQQASFTSDDVENWFEGVRLKAQQALSDM
ncbi:hypothetical protein ACUDCK_29435 (plasmid) [Achromobacter sp. CF-sbj1-Ac2-l]|uniref:hypothetical protein n=1 Tax=Achromobacter TaxID=222 RepID=UPI0006C1B769|nr:hypothetical protein [Achromobacter xylosoxidans]CUJ63945.1 Uncharacterised protein [Achromobacter xylosoxidans]